MDIDTLEVAIKKTWIDPENAVLLRSGVFVCAEERGICQYPGMEWL